jgi:hypothetical protein
VISNIVVSYSVKPEAVEEHVRLIEAIFAQLAADAPDTVEYQVLRLDDGVSFVHISTAESVDGSHPIPQLESFEAFAADLGSRVVTAPNPTNASTIGVYRPDTPIGH